MKFFTDWRRPDERDDILWIDDDSEHDNLNLGPSDPYSGETWPSENINDPPDKGWDGRFDSVSHVPEIIENTIDTRSEDPEDVLWIDDDDPHDETISGTFSSKPLTSIPFTASSTSVTMEDEVENEGIL